MSVVLTLAGADAGLGGDGRRAGGGRPSRVRRGAHYDCVGGTGPLTVVDANAGMEARTTKESVSSAVSFFMIFSFLFRFSFISFGLFSCAARGSKKYKALRIRDHTRSQPEEKLSKNENRLHQAAGFRKLRVMRD